MEKYAFSILKLLFGHTETHHFGFVLPNANFHEFFMIHENLALEVQNQCDVSHRVQIIIFMIESGLETSFRSSCRI